MIRTNDGTSGRSFLDRRLTLPLIISLGILLRLTYSFIIFPAVAGDLHWKGADDGYDEIARNLLHGDGFTNEAGGLPNLVTPPGYAFFLYALYGLTGEEINEGVRIQLVQPLMDGVTCWLIYLLGLYLFKSRRVGILAALGWALYPQIIVYNARIAPEVLFTLLLTGMMLALFQLMESGRVKHAILVGVLWALAVLVKEKVVFLPPLLLWLAWRGVSLPGRKKALLMLTMTLAMAIPITPWLVRGYLVTGGFVPITLRSGRALRAATVEDFTGADDHLVKFFENRTEREKSESSIPEEEREERIRKRTETERNAMGEALSRIADNPVAFARGFAVKLAAFWYYGQPKVIVGNIIVQIPLVLLALLGYIRGWKRHNLLPFLYLTLYFVLIHALTVTRMRYSIPIMPEIFLVSAFFLIDWFSTRGPRPRTLDGVFR